MPEDAGQTPSNTDSRPDTENANESTGWGFSLPPISLPPIRIPALGFPDDFSPATPVFERVRGSGNALLAAIAVDCIDIVIILSDSSGFLPVVVGTGIGYLVVGPLGLLYAWEILPVIMAVPRLALLPTLSILAVLHLKLLATTPEPN